MKYDVVIIGGGFAGLSAVQQAIERGLTCCVIADKTGASQHFSGAFDLIDPRWLNRQAGVSEPVQLSDSIESFIRAHPQHLYATSAEHDADFTRKLPHAMQSFLQFYNLPHDGDGEQNAIVFAATGAPKPTAFALAGMSLSPQDIAANPAVTFLHTPHLTDYPQNLIAANLQKIFHTVTPIRFDWTVNTSSPLAFLLQEFENESSVERLITQLRGKMGGATVLFLPPILGIRQADVNRSKLASALGVRVVELLSALPSTAGLRFKSGIEQKFAQNNITRIAGRVTSFTAEEQCLQTVTVKSASDGEDVILSAKEFILASGKFTGGGIRHQDRFEESIFNLPLSCGVTPVTAQSHVSSLLAPHAHDAQAFLSLGVTVDAAGRPTAHGRPLWQNLKACGHVLTGFDFTRERCGFGASVASALRCF